MKDSDDQGVPGIQILADDSPPETAASSAAPGGVAAAEEIPFLTPGDGSWIGSRVNKNYEAFLQAHKQDLAAFEEAERETRSCRNQFKWFTNTIAEWQTRLTALREEITHYQGINIENTLFNQCWQTHKSLITIASSPLFQTMLTIKEHGPAMMKLAEQEFGALEKKFLDFKREKRTKLKEFGLI
jgi:hypothetical protein